MNELVWRPFESGCPHVSIKLVDDPSRVKLARGRLTPTCGRPSKGESHVEHVEIREDFGPWLARQLKLDGRTQADLAEQLESDPSRRIGVDHRPSDSARRHDASHRRRLPHRSRERAHAHDRRGEQPSGLLVPPPRLSRRRSGLRQRRRLRLRRRRPGPRPRGQQNSLDERLDRTKPVRVRYTLHELTGESLDVFVRPSAGTISFPTTSPAAAQEQKVGRVMTPGTARHVREVPTDPAEGRRLQRLGSHR